jgi:hypothetical protein
MPRRSDPNHCLQSEVEPMVPLAQRRPRRDAPQSPPRDRIIPPHCEDDDNNEGRELTEDSKVAILKAYTEWLAGGKMASDSPIAGLMEKYGCGRSYPLRLYDKVMAHGSVASLSRGGNQFQYSPGVWEEMVSVIRSRRAKGRLVTPHRRQLEEGLGAGVGPLQVIHRVEEEGSRLQTTMMRSDGGS